jgi:uncharacterized membrane protein
MVFLDYAFPWLFALSMVLLLLVTISYSSFSDGREVGKKAVYVAWVLGTFDLFAFSIDEGLLSSAHVHILFLMVLGTLGSIASIYLNYRYKKTKALSTVGSAN